MKIHFANTNIGQPTGPNMFAHRLARALIENGHELEFNDGASSDVSLVFIQNDGKPLAKRVVLRLDGIWFKPTEFHTHNTLIKRTFDTSDAVVFQSDFDKVFVSKWWGEHKNAIVIRNGIKQDPVMSFSSAALQQIRSKYKRVFVCSANWHPQKRLQTNVQLFKHIRSTIESSSCLIVMGNNPDCVISDRDVFYTGSLPENLCLEVFSMADWMLHCAWLDHAPNVCVEAISQNTPIICTDHGGTKEIVGGFGVVLRETRTYENTLEDYDAPPNVDVTQLVSLPDRSLLSRPTNVSIEASCEAYVKLFKTLC